MDLSQFTGIMPRLVVPSMCGSVIQTSIQSRCRAGVPHGNGACSAKNSSSLRSFSMVSWSLKPRSQSAAVRRATIRTSILDVENRCITCLNELIFQERPAWDEIERAFRSVADLKQVHSDALDLFAAHAGLFPARRMAALLKRSSTVLNESMLILDRIVLNHYRS